LKIKNYAFVTKEEIQEATYIFLTDFIKSHTYISTRILITDIGKTFGFKRSHKDVNGTVFYKKLVQNIKPALKLFVERNEIIRVKKGLYIKNTNNLNL
jgi:hypothetical protein